MNEYCAQGGLTCTNATLPNPDRLQGRDSKSLYDDGTILPSTSALEQAGVRTGPTAEQTATAAKRLPDMHECWSGERGAFITRKRAGREKVEGGHTSAAAAAALDGVQGAVIGLARGSQHDARESAGGARTREVET